MDVLASGSNQPGPSPSAPLQVIKHFLEAKTVDDDWTGLRSSAERRKRQNRLNVRAHRRRKAAQPAGSDRHGAREIGSNRIVDQTLKQSRALHAYRHDDNDPWLLAACTAITRWNSLDIFTLLTPFPNDQRLLILVRYNLTRAIATNMTLLNLTQITIDDGCTLVRGDIELFPHVQSDNVPGSLRPTDLQRTVSHAQWIDLLPDPRLRDALIRHADAFDECEFMADATGMHMNVDGRPTRWTRAGMLAWAEPWSARGWELMPEFARKWAFLLRECHDLLVATNYWRGLRHEDPIFIDVGG